jgi:hypothetical protein
MAKLNLSKEDALAVWFAVGGNDNIPQKFRGGRSKTQAIQDLRSFQTITNGPVEDFRRSLCGNRLALAARQEILKRAKKMTKQPVAA